MTKRLVLVIKILFLAGFVLLGSGCSLKSTATTQLPPSSDFANQDDKEAMKLTQEHLLKAKEAAKNWQEDAYFVSYNFKVPQNLDPKTLTETFVFGSQKVQNNWWTYTLDSQGKFVRAEIPKEDFLGKDLIPIKEEFWKTGYVQTFRTAENNGGITFRSKYPETIISFNLSQSPPNSWLWYVIDYTSASNNQRVRISANDGKIYNEQGVISQNVNNPINPTGSSIK